MVEQTIYGIASIQDTARNETVTVTASSTIVSSTRTGLAPRKLLLIRNISTDSTYVVTVNLGATTATANTGIVLKQYESFTDSTDNGYTCFQGTVTAINAVAGNATLAVLER